MRIGFKARKLSKDEQVLATLVFKNTLPSWDDITIDDGLGWGDAPFTVDDNDIGKTYLIHIGPVAYPDCTSKASIPGFGPVDATFVHEMTHVWQYFHDYYVRSSSIWAQTLGDGYIVKLPLDPGKSWSDYNVEQQARIVEKWYLGGRNPNDDRYQYVQKVIWLDDGCKNLTLDELRKIDKRGKPDWWPKGWPWKMPT